MNIAEGLSTNAIIMIISATLAWIATFWSISQAPQKTNKTAANIWGFTASFAIAATMQIDFVFVAVTRFFGITNLAWLVSYMAGAFSLYMMVHVMHERMKLQSRAFSARYALIGTWLLLLIIFPAVAKGTDVVGRQYPVTLPEFAFMQVLYAYTTFMCFYVFNAFYRLQHEDVAMPVRLRWILIASSTFLGGVFFGSRSVIYNPIAFVFPSLAENSAILIAFNSVLRVVFVLSVVSWSLFFLPKGIMQKIARFIIFIDKLLMLRDLNELQDRIVSVYPSTTIATTTEVSHSWWLRVQNLDFYLYRSIIAILDSKKKLQANMDEQAQKLFEALNSVHDEAEFQALLTAYRTIGKQYRKKVMAS
jgi:hypothetical protein